MEQENRYTLTNPNEWTEQDHQLLLELDDYFKDDNYKVHIIAQINNGNHKWWSLRQLDFIAEDHPDNPYSEGKRNIDAFRRARRLTYRCINSDEIVETSMAQLNFFRWVFEQNLIY